ncbi:hypothetical protein SAMN02745664_1442 [Moraxella cuniculi DSM 21768]|uniref:Uncharacterized protein n=2 Tax=Moraxella cuniculi TaxID=34061 RepID=A0A1N7GDP0_9GAMM|nr:hypothetical protein SAMN02745664_1442 [Moraxella cuniculi DSM 21768]VEG12941.1 Uncharacterised protein [Moraxella cuniculi]
MKNDIFFIFMFFIFVLLIAFLKTIIAYLLVAFGYISV